MFYGQPENREWRILLSPGPLVDSHFAETGRCACGSPHVCDSPTCATPPRVRLPYVCDSPTCETQWRSTRRAPPMSCTLLVLPLAAARSRASSSLEFGRESCRERVCTTVLHAGVD